MALTYNGSTQATRLALALSVIAQQTFSASVWVKTSSAGTTRLCAYNEADTAPAGTADFFIAVNDGTNGQVRIFRRSDDSTTVSLTWNGSVADNAWHLVTYVANGWNSHSLFVDDDPTAKATSATSFSGKAFAAAGTRYIGLRNASGVKSSYFNGSIADHALYNVALTGAQHVELYNKTKWPFTVTGTASDVRSFCGLSATDDHDMANPLYNAANENSPTLATGPSGTYKPAGSATSTFSSTTPPVRLMKPTATTMLATGANTWRETGNIIHTPADTGKEYKLYYSLEGAGYGGDKSDVEIGMAYASSVTGTWTDYGVVIAQDATYGWEDPFVVVDGGTYYLWCENKRGGDNAYGIAYFTSSDGIAWTRQDSDGSPALDNGTSGAWDDQDVSSPTVILDGGTWYMLYEGRKTSGQQGQIGLATASSPGGAWTKSGSNPVLTESTSTWEAGELVPDDITKIGSTYYVVYHANDGTYWGTGYAHSTTFTSWTRPALNQLTGGDESYSAQLTPGLSQLFLLDNDDGDPYLWDLISATANAFNPAWARGRNALISAGAMA